MGVRRSGWTRLVSAVILTTSMASGCARSPVEMTAGTSSLHAHLDRSSRSEESELRFLHRPLDLVARGDSTFVVDSGNDRIVVFDHSLRPVSTFGQTGGGPGEFEMPTAVHLWRDTLIIADVNNRRFDFFTIDGRYVRSLRTAFVSSAFSVLGGGQIVVAVRDRGYFAGHIAVDGSINRTAPAPAHPRMPFRRRYARARPLLAVTPGDTLHVFDQETGVLRKFSPQGEEVLARSLPDALLERIVANRSRLIRGLAKQGIRTRSVPLLKSLHATAEGDLLLLLPDVRSAVILVDARTYTYSEIAAPSPAEATPLRSAVAATARNGVLTIINQDGLFTYRIQEDRGAD